MKDNPRRHDESKNCQRPLALDDGFLAPTPDWIRSREPPDSRERTQAAKPRHLAGTVAACWMTRAWFPRDGRLSATALSSSRCTGSDATEVSTIGCAALCGARATNISAVTASAVILSAYFTRLPMLAVPCRRVRKSDVQGLLGHWHAAYSVMTHKVTASER